MTVSADGGEDRLAPVIPLFGGRVAAQDAPIEATEPEWRSTWEADPRPAIAETPDAEDAVDDAEQALLRKLRGRSLSVSEARNLLRDRDLDPALEESLLERFVELGYLDDARLAEQLVHAGTDRKGQGRKAIAMALAKRGIPRDIADAALQELPDDDFERALEFARTKVWAMRSLERDTAVRRLSGQLARRGYGGSNAVDAARQAWDEASRPSGPRFV